MDEEQLTQQQINDIEDVVKRLFPSDSQVNLTITEEGTLRDFDVYATMNLSSSVIAELAQNWLMDFTYTDDLILAKLRDYLYENNHCLNKFDYKNKIFDLDLDNFLEKSQRRIGESLKRSMAESLNIYTDFDKLFDKIKSEMVYRINQCLTDKTKQTLESFAQNKTLSFILRKSNFIPNNVGVYNPDSVVDLNRLVKDLSEVGELAKLATHSDFKDIATAFMKSLNRTDNENLEQLVKTFTDTYVNQLAGQKLFVESYLYEIVTTYGYTLVNGYLVVDVNP